MSLVQIPPLDNRKLFSSSCQGAAVSPADIPEMMWVIGASGSGSHGRILECNLQPITVTSPLTMASCMSPLGHPLVASGWCLARGWTVSHSALLALMYNPRYVCPVLLYLLTFPGKPLGDRHMDLRCTRSDASISLTRVLSIPDTSTLFDRSACLSPATLGPFPHPLLLYL